MSEEKQERTLADKLRIAATVIEILILILGTSMSIHYTGRALKYDKGYSWYYAFAALGIVFIVILFIWLTSKFAWALGLAFVIVYFFVAGFAAMLCEAHACTVEDELAAQKKAQEAMESSAATDPSKATDPTEATDPTATSETKAPSGPITKEDLYGQYVCEEPGFPDLFTITLRQDGTFDYYEGSSSSYFGGGAWELSENRVTLHDVDYGEEWDFFFTVEDGCLVFDKGASHHFIYTNPPDKVRFLRMDQVDETWLANLEEQGWEADRKRIEGLKEEVAKMEDERKKYLNQAHEFSFQGTDFTGLVWFDASDHQVNVSIPIKIWVEDADGKMLWYTSIGHLPETQNAFYLYTSENGTNYLIEYDVNYSYHFDMFTLNSVGDIMDETACDFPATATMEQRREFNETAKKYVMNAKPLIGTSGGGVAVDMTN
ncbi:MAG: hypothetical protein IKH28_06940 [Lachnospiraceae bacterium]|nr:hypothetical protein [Lachnospiraceae bacterium]